MGWPRLSPRAWLRTKGWGGAGKGGAGAGERVRGVGGGERGWVVKRGWGHSGGRGGGRGRVGIGYLLYLG